MRFYLFFMVTMFTIIGIGALFLTFTVFWGFVIPAVLAFVVAAGFGWCAFVDD